ncbi:M24 family metallopeptidase [Leuconostoc palmae]|uniref:M24 family metallopeptidase n=1 Tax=Leuconostoc palmae TaxID=501487 RepID=UPI001C7DE7A1|nr:Xaa-Pro peptidase family protein [Leuconostoc palmae]
MNINKLHEMTNWLNKEHLDGVILTDYHDIAYLTGFNSDPIERVLALVLFANYEPFLFGPALEVNSMVVSGWQFDTVGYEDNQNPWKMIASKLKSLTSGTQFAIQFDQITLSRYNALKKALPNVSFLKDATGQINQMRLIKSKDELQKMKVAGQEADKAFEIGFNLMENGISEISLASDIEYQLKKLGISNMSFETLVQFGAHAANPHGTSSLIPLKSHEMVLFDLGTIHDGYASDATRTIAYGKVDDLSEKIHAVVLEAQLTAQSKAKIGMTANELDNIARKVITKAGFGPNFVHRLGHGLGTSVHEFPSIVAGNDLILKEGMAFSIEPGIYIPNMAGVRIEDSGYMSKNGFIPFTETSKSLYQH